MQMLNRKNYRIILLTVIKHCNAPVKKKITLHPGSEKERGEEKNKKKKQGRGGKESERERETE